MRRPRPLPAPVAATAAAATTTTTNATSSSSPAAAVAFVGARAGLPNFKHRNSNKEKRKNVKKNKYLPSVPPVKFGPEFPVGKEGFVLNTFV